jgi:hypothetical protein
MALMVSTVVLPTVTNELLVRWVKSSMPLDYAHGQARRGHGDKKIFCGSGPVRPGRPHGKDGENGGGPWMQN